MSIGVLYWICMLLWIVLAGVYGPRPWGKASIPDVILLVLFGLIGWQLFGAAVHR